MADNVAVTPGTGATIATDDVGGVQYQRVKVDGGGDGAATPILAGGGVEASALRVTIASDSTGVVSVDDNGSTLSIDDGGSTISIDDGGASLTVDGTVAANMRDGAGTALTSATRGAEQALSVQLVDGSGNQVTSFGGGTQYTEGDTDSSITGTAGLWEDSGNTLRATSASYPMPVNVIGGYSSGFVHPIDATVGSTDGGALCLAMRADTPTVVNTGDGKYEPMQMSSGRLWVSAVVSAASTSIGKFEDGASASGDVGVPAMAIQQSSPADTAGTNGDYAMLQMSAGRLWSSSQSYGDVAHDAADSGNPVKVGHKAKSALSGVTLVADADRADSVSDLDGAVVNRPFVPLGDVIMERVSDTGGTSTAFSNFGATASTRNYLTTITVYNDSSTTGYLDIRDGTSGTVLHTIPLPAKGGGTVNFPIPLRSTANTAIAYDVSGALTTVYISVIGFKSKC